MAHSPAELKWHLVLPTLSADDLFWPLTSVFCFFLAFSLFLTLKRLVSITVHHLRTRNIVQIERAILACAESASPRPLPKLPRNREIRDLLVALGAKFTGEIRSTLQKLYVQQGFSNQDRRALLGWGFEQKMLALNRQRTLGISIPEKYWARLSRTTNLGFRWAFMEYLVQQKGKSAVPWIMGFISQPENQKRGIILHLICCLARVSPETIRILLEYSDNELLREQALRALVVYPIPGIERLIVQCIRRSSSEEMLVAGIKALVAHPHTDWLPYLETFIDHPNWVLRMLIAKGLGHSADSKSMELLNHLSEDMSYHVRLAAIQNLLQQRPASSKILQHIHNTPSHPAHYIYNQIVGRDSFGSKKGWVA